MLKYDSDLLEGYERALLKEIMPAIREAKDNISRAGRHFDWCCPELQQINELADGCARRIEQNYHVAEDLAASTRSVVAIFSDKFKAREAALNAFPNQVHLLQ